MGKIKLALIVCTCLMLSCCSIPRHIKNAFTNCYANTYTGLDTLINIDGYYGEMIFYDNGMAIRTIYHLRESDCPKYSSYMDEVIVNPHSKCAKKFYNSIDCGSYVIYGDTIKVQMISDYNSHTGWDSWEKWNKIVDKNILTILENFRLTTNKEEREHSGEYYKSINPSPGVVSFVPMPFKPTLGRFWILKEKWFWCNEQDWENYMKHIEQLKKQFKKK